MLDRGAEATARELRTPSGRAFAVTSEATSANLRRYASRRVAGAEREGFRVRFESRERLREAEAIRVVLAGPDERVRVHYLATFAGRGWDIGIVLGPDDLRDGLIDFERSVSTLRLAPAPADARG